ncbi:hypothetical protein GIB67_016613 [Kingdonia uniflora]|uniref:N-acetyltransferase domain-containing protein n=1 Tax=Kingdonia uniflora TaxID=39325 RepID=A0A7J7MZ99_9MAGN|nr:hypothetical protein GIB67_016613 [Kingdonia uniflora]
MAGNTNSSSSSLISIGNCRVEVQGRNFICESSGRDNLKISVSNDVKINISGANFSPLWIILNNGEDLMAVCGNGVAERGDSCLGNLFFLINPKDVDSRRKSLLQALGDSLFLVIVELDWRSSKFCPLIYNYPFGVQPFAMAAELGESTHNNLLPEFISSGFHSPAGPTTLPPTFVESEKSLGEENLTTGVASPIEVWSETTIGKRKPTGFCVHIKKRIRWKLLWRRTETFVERGILREDELVGDPQGVQGEPLIGVFTEIGSKSTISVDVDVVAGITRENTVAGVTIPSRQFVVGDTIVVAKATNKEMGTIGNLNGVQCVSSMRVVAGAATVNRGFVAAGNRDFRAEREKLCEDSLIGVPQGVQWNPLIRVSTGNNAISTMLENPVSVIMSEEERSENDVVLQGAPYQPQTCHQKPEGTPATHTSFVLTNSCHTHVINKTNATHIQIRPKPKPNPALPTDRLQQLQNTRPVKNPLNLSTFTQDCEFFLDNYWDKSPIFDEYPDDVIQKEFIDRFWEGFLASFEKRITMFSSVLGVDRRKDVSDNMVPHTWVQPWVTEVLRMYMNELPTMKYAANTGKESLFLERCVLNGKYCTLLLKSNAIESPGEVIAAVTYQIVPVDAQYAEVPLAAIKSNYQHMGIGHHLYLELRKRLQNVGVCTILCWGDKESEGFWLKQGFVPIAEVDSKGKARRLPLKAAIRRALCFPGGSTLMVSHINKDILTSPLNKSKSLSPRKPHAHSPSLVSAQSKELRASGECHDMLNSSLSKDGAELNEKIPQSKSSLLQLLMKNGCLPDVKKFEDSMQGCKELASTTKMEHDTITVSGDPEKKDDANREHCSCSGVDVKKRAWQASCSSLKSKKVKGGYHIDCHLYSTWDLTSGHDRENESCSDYYSVGASSDKSRAKVISKDFSLTEKNKLVCASSNEDNPQEQILPKGDCQKIMLMDISDDVKKTFLKKVNPFIAYTLPTYFNAIANPWTPVIIEDLGGTITSDGSVSTHVITGKTRKTLNFCTALCSGLVFFSSLFIIIKLCHLELRT